MLRIVNRMSINMASRALAVRFGSSSHGDKQDKYGHDGLGQAKYGYGHHPMEMSKNFQIINRRSMAKQSTTNSASDVIPYLTAENTWKTKVITGVTRDAVWKEAVNKVYNTGQYLPVKDVVTRPNPDGTVWRTMTLGDKAIVETITIDEPSGTIKFHELDSAGKPTNTVHFNVLREEEGGITLDYYTLNTETQQKTPLKGTSAIQKIVERARTTCKK